MFFAGKWIEVESFIVSETNQYHKTKYQIVSPICGSYMKKDYLGGGRGG
jgi:hypothetical protein